MNAGGMGEGQGDYNPTGPIEGAHYAFKIGDHVRLRTPLERWSMHEERNRVFTCGVVVGVCHLGLPPLSREFEAAVYLVMLAENWPGSVECEGPEEFAGFRVSELDYIVYKELPPGFKFPKIL